MADSTARGRFVWHELMTPNGAGAHEFYKKAVGWNTQAWEHDKSYVMFVGPNGPLGASIESRDGAPQWIPYVGTNEVDATVQEATRRGGGVTKPTTSIADGGTYAVLTDPHGATFGVHRGPASQQSPPVAPPKHGEFSWHELATTAQPGAAFEFYSALFGWEKLSEFDMGPMGIYLIFGRDGTQLGGMFNKGDMGKPGAAYWVSYVRVKNVRDTVDRVKSARGALLNGPMDVPGGDQIAQFTDPHGAFFAGHTLAVDVKAAAAAAPAKAAGAAAPPKAAAAAAPPKAAAAAAPPKAAAAAAPPKAAAAAAPPKAAGAAAPPKAAASAAPPKRRPQGLRRKRRRLRQKRQPRKPRRRHPRKRRRRKKSQRRRQRKRRRPRKKLPRANAPAPRNPNRQRQARARAKARQGQGQGQGQGQRQTQRQTPVVLDDHRQQAYARSGAPAQ